MSYLQLRLVALVNRLWFEVCVNQYGALRRYESIVRASNQSRLFRCHNLDAFYLRSTSALRTGLVEGLVRTNPKTIEHHCSSAAEDEARVRYDVVAWH
ncbi:hypothetical protein QC762_0046280 [Podospora pseudocomata]|uniref:Uncharacterized protein n=1 Tax=Podospora pseudocomata TaxID=2093779 RepID=A0ABR0GP06_9PEZI|nr:hypothetical protein QC762_0046280 [Podospora pseudocomata]